jgi:hypothetical protein
MLIYVQWARRNPADYQPIGSEGWASTATKADPTRSTPYNLAELNQQPGWVAELSIQGIQFSGDHYHVRDLTDGSGGVVITEWTDSPTFGPVGQRYAREWAILPLAPDGRFGGALNTRQSVVMYAEGNRYQDYLTNPRENTVLKAWTEFAAPPAAQTRHGIWLSDAAWNAHVAVRTPHGWQEWAT